MKCLNKTTLSLYVDNELPQHRQNEIDAHLHSCPKCKAVLLEIKTEIEFTGAKLELLKPGSIPQKDFIPSPPTEEPATYPTIYPAKKPGIISGIKETLKTSVRIPVPTFGVLLGIIVIMAIGLFIQNQKISQLKSPLHAARNQPTLYMVSESKIQSVPLEADLTGFQPITKPKVFVAKESKNEKNSI